MDLTFTPEGEESEEGEFVEVNEVYLADGQCWVLEADALLPGSDYSGVIAMQYRDGGLYYMTGEERRWVSAEAPEPGKAARKLKTVN